MSLPESKIDAAALQFIKSFHADVVKQVSDAVNKHPVVVVGMAQNPFVKKARAALKKANVDYTYLEYGSYFAEWKKRLAIKLWSRWPTFPQVFVNGVLIGGYSEMRRKLDAGSLKG